MKKKSSPKKSAADSPKKRLKLNDFTEFLIGFFVASILAFVLVNMFQQEVFDFIVNVTGL